MACRGAAWLLTRARSAAPTIPASAPSCATLISASGQRPTAAAGQRALESGPRGIEQQVTRLGYAAADHKAGERH
jgi:hypothetical protein